MSKGFHTLPLFKASLSRVFYKASYGIEGFLGFFSSWGGTMVGKFFVAMATISW